jgi:hypothetical protein
MTTTAILQITELANNQVNHNVTVNEGLAALEKATQDFMAVDLAAADVEIDLEDFLRCFMYVAENNSVARAIEFPANKRGFAVNNTGSDTLTITIGTTDLTLAASASGFYYADGTADGLIKIG